VARAYDAPEGIKLIEWRLLTNRLASTAADVAELIDWNRARWEIEILFNVFKVGCKVEELRLGTSECIERALVLYLAIAWRIAYLVRVGRTCPNLEPSCFSIPTKSRRLTCLTKSALHQLLHSMTSCS
jgi:hypothetical protein